MTDTDQTGQKVTNTIMGILQRNGKEFCKKMVPGLTGICTSMELMSSNEERRRFRDEVVSMMDEGIATYPE